VGTRSPMFRMFVIIMVTFICIDLCLLTALRLGYLDLGGGGDGDDDAAALTGLELLDGDQALNGTIKPNVTHIFALRVTEGEVDTDRYTVQVSKAMLGVWYDANTTAGTIMRADGSQGADTAQFTYKDPYYPRRGSIVEVQILEGKYVVWYSEHAVKLS
jgi:hypothetical protein